MVNEFHNLQLVCVPPNLVPPYGSVANQGCSLPGSTPGTNIVNGDAYLQAQLNYSYSHLWRNVGIVFAFWGFFVVATLVGMEMILKPHKGGGNVNVYRKGGAPESVKKALEENKVVEDDERQREEGAMRQSKKEKQEGELQGIAKSETVFTWSGVNYTIPVKGGKKVLLSDVQGYVKPGRLTALMGGISCTHKTNRRIRRRENDVAQLSCAAGFDRSHYRGDVDRRTTLAQVFSTVDWLRGTIGCT